MSEIEFVEPDNGTAAGSTAESAVEPTLEPAPEAGPHSASGPAYDPDRARFLAGAALWLAAAVLCVVASYQAVYKIGYGSGASAIANNLDAWGTYTGAAAVTAGVHGPQYAHVLILCVALFAVLAASSAGRAVGLRAPRLDGTALAAGIGVTGILVGLVAGIYLEVTSTLDAVKAKIAAEVVAGEPIRADVVTSVGRCAYFAIAAAACSVLAIVVTSRRRHAEM